MVMEVKADMERILGGGFSLRLSDRDDHACGGGNDGSGGRGGLPPTAPGKDDEDDGGCALKERIARALRLYKDAADGAGVAALVQVWAPAPAPARDGEQRRRRVLATRGQPFVLPSRCRRLLQYRTVSLTHVFAVDGGDDCTWEERGLPGRVFDARAPEWTPNVQLYGTGEYARMSYALIYDIQGSLALPVLDPADPRRCLAVLELVFTTAPVACFAAEADKLCKALQAVSLRGSEICHPVPTERCNSETAHATMSEVSELLAAVCEAHELPLAQAWVRCRRCSSTDDDDEDQQFSLTTTGAPFHLAADGAHSGFREACAEHHLRRGQGLIGDAAMAREPRFCSDVARRSKDAYPLAHYARMHGLAGCLAVPLQVPQSAMDDDDGRVEECVVLEFFLPPDCRSAAEQKAAMNIIASAIREQSSGGSLNASAMNSLQDFSLEAVLADADAANELNGHGDYDTNDSDEEDEHRAVDVAEGDQGASIHGADQNGVDDRMLRPPEKKKTGRKAGKPVSLKVLQGYFSGSLKDAARSLGVCPTTMKRICRQHGISRWPYRKISKVNHALGKIRRAAIESVDYSPKPNTASSSSHRAQAPHLPCLPCALAEDTSSQGSSQDPPPLTKTTLGKSLLQRSNAAGELVTIKASYRGDIIRFRVPLSAGVAAVKEEVAKRLGLDSGAFDVKYLDDDHEWVLLSCDADFQECLDVAPALPPSASAATSGGTGMVPPVVRLMVQEVAASLRRSFGSSD